MATICISLGENTLDTAVDAVTKYCVKDMPSVNKVTASAPDTRANIGAPARQ